MSWSQCVCWLWRRWCISRRGVPTSWKWWWCPPSLRSPSHHTSASPLSGLPIATASWMSSSTQWCTRAFATMWFPSSGDVSAWSPCRWPQKALYTPKMDTTKKPAESQGSLRTIWWPGTLKNHNCYTFYVPTHTVRNCSYYVRILRCWCSAYFESNGENAIILTYTTVCRYSSNEIDIMVG